MTHSLTRRSFLLTAAGAVTGVAVMARRLKPWRVLVEVDSDSDRRARLAGLFTRSESAAVIGRAYLASVPGEADIDKLTDRVVAGLPAGIDTITASDDHLRQALARRIEDDFATTRIVNVDGWIVSQTEARLCALAALGRHT